MFNKIINITLDPRYTTVIDNELLKTAASQDFLNGQKFDPDFVYLLIRSVSAGEYWGPNNNVDFFEEMELTQNHNTFLEAKVFKNHDNKDVANSIGDVLKSEWDDKMKAVMLVVRIDKTIAPTIARGFLKGTITDVSMGCRVDHVICSYCGQRAKTRKDYCEHLRDPQYRGKIMPGGKRVYEINKGPKFHDISVVTKGADRTAKAFKIVDGEEAVKQEGLAKVASLESRLENYEMKKVYETDYKLTPEDLGFKKVAASSFMKLAEIDKIIQGNLAAIAGAQKFEEATEKSDEVMEVLRLFYTKYFDEKTIDEIVSKIKVIATEKKRPPEEIFRTFLRTAELAGIELTPLEFSSMIKKLSGDKSVDPFALSESASKSIEPKAIKTVIKLSRGDHMPGARGMMIGNSFFDKLFPKPEVDVEEDIFKSILSPFMSGRSHHPQHVGNRIMMIIKTDQEPDYSNLKHFALPFVSMSKLASEYIASDMQSYYGYQNERVALAASGDIEKYAGIVTGEDVAMIKEAKVSNRMKQVYFNAALYPATQGYSKYQQARIEDGERISPFNRFMAENPVNAFILATLGLHYARGGKKRAAESLKNKFGKVKETLDGAKKGDLTKALDPDAFGQTQMADTVKATMSNVGDETTRRFTDTPIDYVDGYGKLFNKHASGDTLFIFDNDQINNEMLKTYSGDKVDIMKLAMSEYVKGNDTDADELLSKNALQTSDLNSYLKTALDLITIELEKLADDAIANSSNKGELARDIAADTFFYPRNTGMGMGTLLPGSIVDGFIINKMFKKLQKDTTTNPAVDSIEPQFKTVQNNKEAKFNA